MMPSISHILRSLAPPKAPNFSDKDMSVANDDEVDHMLSPSEAQDYLPIYREPKRSASRSISLALLRYILLTALFILGIGILLALAVKQVFFNHTSSMAHDMAHTMPLPPAPPSTTVMVSPCGNNSMTAQALGCRFDYIVFAWLPPRCHDEELAKSFRDTKFKWYLGPDNTDEISQQEAFTGEFPALYVNWEYHLLHCTYMWRKMHRSILGEGKATLDGVGRDYVHTEHCETMLLRRKEVGYEDVNTVVKVKYPDCGAS